MGAGIINHSISKGISMKYALILTCALYSSLCSAVTIEEGMIILNQAIANDRAHIAAIDRALSKVNAELAGAQSSNDQQKSQKAKKVLGYAKRDLYKHIQQVKKGLHIVSMRWLKNQKRAQGNSNQE